MALVNVACAVWCCAQAPDSPALQRARQEAARVEALVEAGALPRTSLEQVRQDLADAQDAAILEKTLYGNLAIEDLTEQQADEMLAAATRRFDRQKVKLEHAKKLVEEGALSQLSLTPFIEEVDRSRRTLNLAHSRASLLRQLADMARVEQAVLATPEQAPELQDYLRLAERYDGQGVFRWAQLKEIALAFEKRFAKPLPISARGDTAVHRALGFDHRGRVDVAVDPDQPEGVWLRNFLRASRIPFFAFRTFLRGKSTGPHIHIGLPSDSLRGGG